MKLGKIIDDYHIEVYELNHSPYINSMFGTLLYRGNAKLLVGGILERNMLRLFELKDLGKTVVIVE